MKNRLVVIRIANIDSATKKGPKKQATAILQGGSEILKVTLTLTGRPDRVRETLEKLSAYYIGGEVFVTIEPTQKEEERGDGDVVNESEEGSQ